MYGSQRKDNPKHPLLHLYLHLPTIRHKESIQKKVHENIFVKETPSGSQKKIWVILEERITKSDNPRTKKKAHREKELGEPIPTRDRKLKTHRNKLATQVQKKQPRESRETVVLVLVLFPFSFLVFLFLFPCFI
jgi:hypothetical protein